MIDYSNLDNIGAITFDDLALAVGRWLLVDDNLHIALLDHINAALPEGTRWFQDGSVLASEMVDINAIVNDAVYDVLEDVRINYPGLDDK